MKQPTVTIRQLSKLLGRMTGAATAVLSAPIRYCHLQHLKMQSLKQLKGIQPAGDPGREDSGGTAVVVN